MKLKYIIPFLALFLLACDSDDDGFYNTVYIQATDLMTIQNPSATYNVGDVIGIEAAIPRLFDEPGQTEPLDILQTTNADNFQFAFLLERLNANNEWEVLDMTDNYVEGTDGSAIVDYYVQGFVEYDAVADSYLYNGGIALNQAGTYRLNFTNNTDFFNKVYFVSDSENNNVVLNIFSAASDLDANGLFQFTVN
jgi:hypothetical protein